MGVAGDTSTCGRIEALGNSRYRITVQWDDQRAGGSSTRRGNRGAHMNGMAYRAGRRRSAGFSLIELMIAPVLG